MKLHEICAESRIPAARRRVVVKVSPLIYLWAALAVLPLSAVPLVGHMLPWWLAVGGGLWTGWVVAMAYCSGRRAGREEAAREAL
jgi:hypothetical protein